MQTADRDAATTGDTLGTITDDERVERRRQRIRAVGLTLLAVLVLAGLSGWLGVRSGHARVGGPHGLMMDVEYPQVARPGLSAALTITIHSAGGFSDPIDVSIPTSYVQAYDENGFHPDPAESTVDGERTHWTFDPPDGNTLTVWFDHRLGPGVQWRHDGDVTVAVGDRTVRTSFTTWVLP